ncbi:HPr kinase/phosphorylase [Faunimonas pinastri]|uniref:HPr kinase/phosphorylase n=1 Tax=Faunimonas pinastri TaxID=1855383 RepID=UPI0021014D7D|nr:HPr kinase/phosphatase C-terminal domain-containing protein [Faunimonas pinastri]
MHASAVLYRGLGLLIRGPSGSGKSRLAEALIRRGGTLVADDRVFVAARAGRLLACAPRAIAGLLELRGRGLVARPVERQVVLALVLDIVAKWERMPPVEDFSICLMQIELARQPVPPHPDIALPLVEAALDRIEESRN